MSKPFPEISGRQWNIFCDLGMSDPISLVDADLSRSFVHERQYGVFYVPPGFHQNAMSFLLAIEMGCADAVDAAKQLGVRFSSGTADHWLKHTPGAAFRSSVGKEIQVATSRGLTVQERRLFAPFCEVFKGFDPSQEPARATGARKPSP